MPNITAQQASSQMAMALWSGFVEVVDESSKSVSCYVKVLDFKGCGVL